MFGPSNKEIACGIWSSTYVIALCIVLIALMIGLYLSRNFKTKQVRTAILVAAIFASSTEVIKILFYYFTYGLEEVEFIPLYFCSLFIYMTFLALSKNKKIETTALSFLFFGGIIGASAFFLYPTACIPNYPIYHFMCLRTMIYHGSMIYIGLLIVITGYYKPNIMHFKNYFKSLIIISLCAYIANLISDKNYMYISEPLNIGLVKDLYNAIPHLYPFLVMIIEICVPFLASYGIYNLVLEIKEGR